MSGMSRDELDLAYNPYPVCPHCGAVDRDAWELDFGPNEAITTFCGSCENDYRVVRHQSVTYSTSAP